MKREEKAFVLIVVQAGIPVIIWGPPGQGKSSFVRSDFAKLGFFVSVLRVNTLAPHQVGGVLVPDLEHHLVRHLPPEWAVELNTHDKSVLFLDDLSAAANAVQTAALGILDERRVGNLTLKSQIIAAANADSLITQRFSLDAAVANRCAHVTFTSDAETYRTDIMNGFPGAEVPEIRGNWQSLVPRKLSLITDFLCSAEGADMLNRAPEQINEKTVAYPTERSWEMVAKVLAACDCIDPEKVNGLDLPEVRRLLFQGCVGEGAHKKFTNYFARPLDVSVTKALQQGRNFNLPESGDKIFGLLWAVSDKLKGSLNQTTWNQAWSLLEGVARTQHRDRGIPLALDLIALNSGRFTLPEFYDQEMRHILEEVA